MKRLCWLVFLLALMMGCGRKETVDLLPDAEPATSALALYVYDGESIVRQFLFHADDKVMNDFRQAKAEPCEVDVTTLQPPYYGLEIGGGEKGTIYGLWADGFYIRGDGKAFHFEYDFEKLLAEYPWKNQKEFKSLTVMPCAGYLAKTEAGWNTGFLTPAEEPVWPNQIGIELVEQRPEEIEVRLVNNTGEDWEYGCSFRVDVRLEEKWYTIPAEQEVVFPAVLLMLPDGGDQVETYRLNVYGALPAGDYRLVTEGGPWVEFEVD